MTTNLAKSINSVLKKTRNLPINILVKSTYLRCNNLFNQRGREVKAMIRSDHAYTEIINKAMEDAQRKANSHHVLEFDQYDIRFIVQEAINPRKVQPVGNFTISLDQR